MKKMVVSDMQFCGVPVNSFVSVRYERCGFTQLSNKMEIINRPGDNLSYVDCHFDGNYKLDSRYPINIHNCTFTKCPICGEDIDPHHLDWHINDYMGVATLVVNGMAIDIRLDMVNNLGLYLPDIIMKYAKASTLEEIMEELEAIL